MTDDDGDSRSRPRGRPRDRRDYIDLGSEADDQGRRAARASGFAARRDDPGSREHRSAGFRDEARDEAEHDRRGRRQQDEPRQSGGSDNRTGQDDETGGTDRDRSSKGQGDDQDEGATRRSKRRPLVIGIAALVLLLMIGGGLYFWLTTRGKASTDDAYTDGNIVSIAPQVAGQVITLDVTDNQFVHKGDPLFHIDPRQYVYRQEQAQGQLDANTAQIANQKLGVEIARKNFPAALALAQANLASAKANLALQQANYDRQKSLPKLATTQQDVDTTAANYQQAKAQVEQAEARVTQAMPVQQNIGQSQQQVDQLQGQAEQAKGQLDQAILNVEWSVVRAPQDGWVTKRNVNAGDYLTAGQQVMSLVTTDVWVTANYKETELDGMHPGQPVTITVDAYPNLDLHGHVDSLQRGSGSKFSAFPAENATGNFIKIVQRVPVKIVIDSGLKKDEPLPLGISVEPTVMLK
ncbi:membrane fusion protein, multidrug efflux system [Methylobacterium phyllostachyos]|uniref:Membrane fusion protein, multidrug efflux system n=1 Tax=Methylobacterium phyllostachyos TaxID=582672 RepID=A0A1H0D4B2_9HYPH|nr:HlyD family secretion protein [Methylobacterium phyllostachyos]SDN65014.1 membrane fusion protein, multidrug efflux system [Methylobacterium phyllostachyos]